MAPRLDRALLRSALQHLPPLGPLGRCSCTRQPIDAPSRTYCIGPGAPRRRPRITTQRSEILEPSHPRTGSALGAILVVESPWQCSRRVTAGRSDLSRRSARGVWTPPDERSRSGLIIVERIASRWPASQSLDFMPAGVSETCRVRASHVAGLSPRLVRQGTAAPTRASRRVAQAPASRERWCSPPPTSPRS